MFNILADWFKQICKIKYLYTLAIADFEQEKKYPVELHKSVINICDITGLLNNGSTLN